MAIKDNDIRALQPIFIRDVSNIYRNFQIFLSEELAPYGINPSAFPIIMALLMYKEEGFLQDELVRAVGISKSAITRALLELEKNAYIYRVQSSHSKRHKHIFATDKLILLDDSLHTIVKNWEKKLFSVASEKEMEDASNTLFKISLFTYEHFRNKKK